MQELKHSSIDSKGGFREEGNDSCCVSLLIRQFLFENLFEQRFGHKKVEDREMLRRGRRSRSSRQAGVHPKGILAQCILALVSFWSLSAAVSTQDWLNVF